MANIRGKPKSGGAKLAKPKKVLPKIKLPKPKPISRRKKR